MTTRVLPKLRHDRLALKLNGKDDRLQRLRASVDGITLPKGMEFTEDARKIADEATNLCRQRIEGLI